MEQHKRTFLLESESGPTLFDKPDGRTLGLSGQDLVHANPSQLPEEELEPQINGTSGPSGSSLSEPASLLLSSESKSARQRSLDLTEALGKQLQNDLKGRGSTLYKLTWSQQATPLGMPYYRLQASALRTSATASISSLAGWATPAAREAGGTPEQFLERKRKAKEKGAQLGVSLTSLALQAQLAASGQEQNGSPAGTENTGQLNPELSRWLQGLPKEWGEAAPRKSKATETRSARKQR